VFFNSVFLCLCGSFRWCDGSDTALSKTRAPSQPELPRRRRVIVFAASNRTIVRSMKLNNATSAVNDAQRVGHAVDRVAVDVNSPTS